MSYREIANQLCFTERQIRGKINNMGMTKLRGFNKDYFKGAVTHNQAYWLGFIYADGYIVDNPTNRCYELAIEINSQDCDLLYEFNEELGGVHKILLKHNRKSFNGYDYETDSCIIRVYSKDIVEDLMELGVVPNKTNEISFPTCNNYFWDFVRGFNDGDGCIYVNPRNYISVKFVNSNEAFLKYIKEKIFDNLGIKGSIYKEKDKKYQLTYFRQSDVKLLLDHLYQNDEHPRLDRKYEIYKSYYGLPA